MNNAKMIFCLIFSIGFLCVFSLPVQAEILEGADYGSSVSGCYNPCCGWNKWDARVEARVAYYHPTSSKVRRIYGNGWADYQLEFSSGLGKLWGIGDLLGNSTVRLCTAVSGFSRKGDSIGFHDHTTIQLIPISLGLKYYYPIACNTEFYLGCAACYSRLRIRDHSPYVHEHVRKWAWGGMVQAGVTYSFWDCAFVSAFFDYIFQNFDFSDSDRSYGYGSSYYYGSRYIERNSLNMNGYKVGVGLGVGF